MPDKYLVEHHLPPHKSIDSTTFPLSLDNQQHHDYHRLAAKGPS